MDFPDDLYYTKDHEWLRLSSDGSVATVGITAFAQQELGDIVYVDLEPEGSNLDQEAVFGFVEAVKTVSDLLMPVSGIVTAVNEALGDNPERVNEDPYGEGWMIKIEMSAPDQVAALMKPADYAAMVG